VPAAVVLTPNEAVRLLNRWWAAARQREGQDQGAGMAYGAGQHGGQQRGCHADFESRAHVFFISLAGRERGPAGLCTPPWEQKPDQGSGQQLHVLTEGLFLATLVKARSGPTSCRRWLP